MSKTPVNTTDIENEDLETVDVLDDSAVLPEDNELTRSADQKLIQPVTSLSNAVRDRQRSLRLYILLPILFLTVALLGGLRLASPDNGFVFMAPALICLFFAIVLIVLFVRGGLIEFDGWFSDDYPISQNISNGVLMVSLFAATVQVFNSALPETGLPFWVVSFCFAWSLWNNLFAAFDNKRLLRSMIALFAFAFVAKYVLLAGLTAPTGDSWLRSMIENPAKETVTWMLELPRYSGGTGYIQFFCLLFYFAGLYMLPKSAR